MAPKKIGVDASQELIIRLRRKFVATNMVFVSVVLAVVFLTVCKINYDQRVDDVYHAVMRGSEMAAKVAYAGENNIALVVDPGLDEIIGLNLDAAGVNGSGQAANPSGNSGSSSGSQSGTGSADSGENAHGRGSFGSIDDAERAPDRRESGEDQFIATTIVKVDADGAIDGAYEDPLGLESSVLASACSQAMSACGGSGKMDSEGDIPSLKLYYHVRSVGDSYVVALASSNYVDNSMASLVSVLALACLAALAAFFAISLLLSRWATRPTEIAWRQQQQFIADASHELKTPLTVIRANDSLLMSTPDETIASQMQWIESTETEVESLQTLVNDMLYLARFDGTGPEVTLSSVDFSDIVRSCVLQFESVAFERGVLIEDDIEDDIMVEGDIARLSRLVGTLVDNACKYVDEGGEVTVTLSRKDSRCSLAVNNTGAVIDKEDLPHLFDRFYRSDKARTRGAGGFGLGLSIAKSVVDFHNGSISVSSDADSGTTFTVSLPVLKDRG